MSLNFKHPDLLPATWFSKISSGIYSQYKDVLRFYPNAGPAADFASLIHAKQDFPQANRDSLVQVLLAQYGSLAQGKVLENIRKLQEKETFTVTTGQQIHLGLGPLYVIYKALTAIQLAEDIERSSPGISVVPVFWMATEDHDFEEIRHIRIFNKTYTWEAESGGPVGRLDTCNIAKLWDEISADFPNDSELQQWVQHFKKVYSEQQNLANATRSLLHEIFHEKGLLVLDPDSPELKKIAIPLFQEDLRTNRFYDALKQRTSELKQHGLEVQIGARPVNLFLIDNGKRRRIEKINSDFALADTNVVFSEKEILETLENETDRFSPNVALRPLFQEMVLPNIAYIGGPGELVYWYQIQPLFAAAGIPTPALIQRHSFIWPDKKSMEVVNSGFLELDIYFQSDIDFQQRYFEERIAASPIITGAAHVEILAEKINKELYSEKSIHLKEVKKMGEEYLKMLRKAKEAFLETMKTTGTTAQDWNKYSKIKMRYFAADKAQERVIHFLEMKMLHSEFPLNLFPLPELSKSPIWVVCD
jgi:bacillithiol biosynthesis cysteine-adding enzyme BshC